MRGIEEADVAFSPLSRGCSDLDRARVQNHVVFPAHAGMFQSA